MDDPAVKRAMWVLALPTAGALAVAVLVGAGLAALTNAPLWLGAICAWMITAVGSTALMAQKSGWSQAIGIVALATAMGVGASVAVGLLVVVVGFGLLLAVCGGGR